MCGSCKDRYRHSSISTVSISAIFDLPPFICSTIHGHRELLDGRLYRPDSEQRPLVSNYTTVAIVKLCCHNFTQNPNFVIFLCVYYFL